MERKDSKRWTPELVHGNDHGRLVDYILLAEFDIDTGSTVRHIFPKPIPNYSNDYFADYMLPEGAHNRDSDHTFIFLNRDAPQSDNPYVNHTENILIHTNTNINSSMMISSDHIGNSSSIVTSSITNTTTIDVTKKDDDNNNNSNSAADDNNDNSNTNNHNNGNNDKEGNSISNSNNNENTNANTSTNKKKPYFLYGLNIVKRKHNSNVRRGAIVKAMAIFSRYHYLELFKKPLDQALELYFQASDNTITNNTNDNSPHSNSANTTEQLTILKSLYGALNSIDLTSLPKPNYLELNLMRRGIKYDSIIRNNMNYYFPKAWIEKVHCYFNGKSIPLSVHLYRTNDEIGDIHVTKLLKVFGENTMRIFHSILTKQKVLFVGYNHAASDVAGMVLSAIAMIAPPLHNIIRRVYPYANLSDLSFLEVQGYIAGVTNPMFQQHENWWDLLCILDLPNHTGHVYGRGEKRTEDPLAMRSSAANHSAASNSSAAGSTRQNISYEDLPHYSVDHKFIVGVLSGIHHGSLNELWVRQQFYDYTFAIVNHTQDKGILINTNKLGEEAKKFLDANAERMQILSNTSEFREMVQNPWMLLCKNNSIETVTTGYQANLIEQKTIHTIDENRRRSADFTSKKVNLQLSDDIQSIAGDLANTKNDPTFVTPMKAKEGKESTQLSLQQPFTKTNNTDNNTPITPMTPSSPNKVSANGFLMKAYVRKLQYEKNINTFKEAPQYFLHLERNLNSESSLQALLLLLPESTGGLLPIAMGLFHPSPTVKLCTTNILSKLKLFKSTEQAFHSINGFIITAYERNLSKLEDGSLEIEAEKEQNFLAAIPSTPNLYDVRGVPSNAMKRELTPPMSGTDAEKKIESNNNSNSDTNIGERDSFTQLTESLTISSSIAMLQQSITDFVSDVDINNSDKPQGFSTTIDELDMIF